jgi:hypothetical protein
MVTTDEDTIKYAEFHNTVSRSSMADLDLGEPKRPRVMS